MEKTIVKISPFKVTIDKETKTQLLGDTEETITKTVRVIESHHEIICQIEGDFIPEFSDLIEDIFSKAKEETTYNSNGSRTYKTNRDPLHEITYEEVNDQFQEVHLGSAIYIGFTGILSSPVRKRLESDGYEIVDTEEGVKIRR